jgi:hypothetical protein
LRKEFREKLEKLFPKLMPKKTTETPAERTLKETVGSVTGGANKIDPEDMGTNQGRQAPPGRSNFMPILLIAGALALVLLLRR